ncbi:hypothetical protein EDEG_01001, partial [Edhazardia aedis USNM 41457]
MKRKNIVINFVEKTTISLSILCILFIGKLSGEADAAGAQMLASGPDSATSNPSMDEKLGTSSLNASEGANPADLGMKGPTDQRADGMQNSSNGAEQFKPDDKGSLNGQSDPSNTGDSKNDSLAANPDPSNPDGTPKEQKTEEL